MEFINDMVGILSNAGVGIEGNNLFGGDLPATPDDAICLYEYAGKTPSRIAQHRHPGLQLLVRNVDYVMGREKIEIARSALFGIQNLQDKENDFYLKIEAVQEPTCLGKDANGRFVFVQNFIVTYFEEV